MELQKLNVKFFMEQPNRVALADFIEIFHGWIQATDGIYHDVADYSHMQAGPGIVLVANDANVSVDETGIVAACFQPEKPVERFEPGKIPHGLSRGFGELPQARR